MNWIMLQKCPPPEQIENIEADFSSCAVDSHCENEQKCCENQGKELHFYFSTWQVEWFKMRLLPNGARADY